MLNTEKVFDMLPVVVDLYDKLCIDDYRKKIAEENKGKKLDEQTVGIDLFKYVLKNSGKVKEEVFEIVAVFEGKSIEEIKAQSFMITVKSLKEIFSDKEAMSLFKSAMR
jgi:NifU-like protein involved in Fe-S cluster formation